MSKYHDELLELAEKDEETIKKLITRNYVSAIMDMKLKLKRYLREVEDDNLTFAQQLELKRLDDLIRQLNTSLDDLYDNNYNAIVKHDREQFLREYFGVAYELNQDHKVQVDFNMLDEKVIKESIEFPIQGLRLSQRLYGNRLSDMKLRTKGAVTQGLINGEGYIYMARQISQTGLTDMNHAIMIARTEGNRMRSLARQKGQEEAVSKGVKMEKKWLATLDKRTRHDHAELDGQIVPIDGEFKINGYSTKQPRLFGVAKEDINCRCDTITIVEGFSPELRRDNETGEIIEYKNYKEWAKDKGIDIKSPVIKATPKQPITTPLKVTKPIKIKPNQTTKDYSKLTRSDLNNMSNAKLKSIAKDLAKQRYMQTGMFKTQEEANRAIEMLLNQKRSNTSLIKDIMAMKSKLK